MYVALLGSGIEKENLLLVEDDEDLFKYMSQVPSYFQDVLAKLARSASARCWDGDRFESQMIFCMRYKIFQ